MQFGQFKIGWICPFQTCFVAICWLIVPMGLVADPQTIKSAEKIPIIADRHPQLKKAGSVDAIEEETLKQKDEPNVETLLRQVPGLSLQGEDGYGLRPNIGMRGVSPHRSSKITLMEDGILIAPAPYSAPAAYYFPPLDFMSGIDVKKGVAAVAFGPQNLGGAINLKTKSPPSKAGHSASMRYGSYGEHKLSVSTGGNAGDTGYLIAVSQIGSQGFKTLPHNKPTGFTRQDALVKIEHDINLGSSIHSFEAKAMTGKERSHETYLGLSKSDFQRDPYQRYASSSEDLMEWNRQALSLRHQLELGKLTSQIVLYEHHLRRDWNKFSGFGDKSIDPRELLAGNQDDRYFTEILRGERDSVSQSGADHIVMGRNDRTFLSKGIAFNGNIELGSYGTWLHNLALGFRKHYDDVKRDHTSQSWLMQSGVLKESYKGETLDLKNKSYTSALTSTLSYELESLTSAMTATLRQEVLELCHRNDVPESTNKDECKPSTYLVPGISYAYYVLPQWQLFVGLNKGVGAPNPSNFDHSDLEESRNYELGTRWLTAQSRMDLIGFYSDYINIKGQCTLSSGCDLSTLDQDFSGGKAKVYGSEAILEHRFRRQSIEFPVRSSYTYTFAAFDQNLVSKNPDWGIGQIVSKDPLPYIPMHRYHAALGGETKTMGSSIEYSYTGQSFDQSVQSGRKVLDAYDLWDIRIWHQTTQSIKTQAAVENAFDRAYVSSIRPYGYRPGRPRTLSFGIYGEF